jgi:chemotaxis protein MotB
MISALQGNKTNTHQQTLMRHYAKLLRATWVLRVDGHTDVRPIIGQFKSNWDLSAARAISVVRYLIDKGVKPSRLVAAGFGEFQPIDPGANEEAYRRNRRIEFKLTER